MAVRTRSMLAHPVTLTRPPTLARPIALALAFLVAPAAACLAAERPVALAPGAGSELAASRCASCHSLDYVTINAPFLSREQWQASVAKMRNFGAPLSDDEARAIVAYLVGAYGRAD